MGLLSIAWPGRPALLGAILTLLVHKFPKIRKLTSELFYGRLLSCPDLVPDAILDDLLSMLMETAWYNHVVCVCMEILVLCFSPAIFCCVCVQV